MVNTQRAWGVWGRRNAPSWAPRILGGVAPLAAFGDALACVWHANLLRFEHESSGDAECLVLAALSLALALSALNVWWATTSVRRRHAQT